MRYAAIGIVVSVLIIFGTVFFMLGGGKSMSIYHEDAEARGAILSSDFPRPEGFETATFALG